MDFMSKLLSLQCPYENFGNLYKFYFELHCDEVEIWAERIEGTWSDQIQCSLWNIVKFESKNNPETNWSNL